ncbi:Rab proteins geranylgeranyltransferase component A 2 [Coccomyxa sp. Obi]|nr:Rab proteins geranylgeranyltransferase component A 2 [Coccomyxa sp. Obi]
MGTEISPAEFDLIVIGTGLQESLIAAAAAKREKSVLHLDPAGYYGSHWTSFQLDQYLDWTRSHGCDASEASGHNSSTNTNTVTSSASQGAQQEPQPAPYSPVSREHAAPASCTSDLNAGHLDVAVAANGIGSHERPTMRRTAEAESFLEVPTGSNPGRYTNVEVQRAEGAELGPSREYNIDVAPRVVHCAGSLINALLDAGAQNYLEFKLLQQSYVWRGGRYVRVPASRADIFKDRSLSPVEKRSLMRFLQKAQQSFLGHQSGLEGEKAFVEVLREKGLAQPLRDVIMYALACIPRSQEEPGLAGRPVSAAEGMAALARYMESVGRYGADTAAFLVPLYSGGELPQAFCRVAAVAGALYVLRQPVTSVLLHPDSRSCAGVVTSTGQVLKCKSLATSSGLLPPLLPRDDSAQQSDESPAESAQQPSESPAESAQQQHVSQAMAIIDRPLQEDESQVLVVMPPGVVSNSHPVYALQVGPPTACAPADRYLLYLSTPSAAATAAQDLRPALEALVNVPNVDGSVTAASASQGEEQSHSDTRPNALLVAYYNRVVGTSASALQHQPANVAVCDPPDASIGYEAALQGAQALLQRLYPDMQGEGLFPGGPRADDDESDEEAVQALSEVLDKLGTPRTTADEAV